MRKKKGYKKHTNPMKTGTVCRIPPPPVTSRDRVGHLLLEPTEVGFFIGESGKSSGCYRHLRLSASLGRCSGLWFTTSKNWELDAQDLPPEEWV